MRRFSAQNRVIPGELTGGLRDAPQDATFVSDGVAPQVPASLEVGCASGTVFVDGTETSVSQQSETVTDIDGESADNDEYRYHTLSIDDTGSLVVNSSPIGEFDSSDPDAEPVTQVVEPDHPDGNVFIGTAIQFASGVDRVFDGRYVLDSRYFVPSGAIVMWSGAIAEIPEGWTLCDGTDGTPDLTDRFVAGAGGQYSVGDTGGEDEHTLTEDEIPAHSHTVRGGGTTETGTGNVEETDGSQNNIPTTETGGDQPHENRPPYYALAYIQKV